MTDQLSQAEKARKLLDLHHSGSMLVLPNIWDPLGARLLETLAYPAIATASAAIANSNGYHDGEQIPFEQVLERLQAIVKNVDIPVTADVESGYASDHKQLRENIKRLIDTGIAGINLEDTDRQSGGLLSLEEQCARLEIVRQTAQESGIHLFINARTDVYLHGRDFESPKASLEEVLRRGTAYKNAGADGFFPIFIKQRSDIETVLQTLNMPLNVFAVAGIPELHELNAMGVARLSLGPGFLKIALKAMKDLALRLKNLEGLADITGNDFTSDYLKNLIRKH